MTKENDIQVTYCDIEYVKKPIEVILKEAEDINPDDIATEVLEWLITNVENYIDNKVKMFRLDLVLDSSESLKAVKKLQDLYRAIPDNPKEIEKLSYEDREIRENECVKCRRSLDVITDLAYQKMTQDKQRLRQLFKRLVYYYELKGISRGQPLIKELDGSVAIIRFEYEAFSMGVSLSAKKNEELEEPEEQFLVTDEKEVIKQYTVEEGFTVWIELAFKSKDRPTSLF